MDLTAFHVRVGSREGSGGRAAFDPAVLLTLFALAHDVLRAVAPPAASSKPSLPTP